MHPLSKFLELYSYYFQETATITPYKKDHRMEPNIQVKYSKPESISHSPSLFQSPLVFISLIFPIDTHGCQSWLLCFLNVVCFMFILPTGEELCTVQTPGPLLPRHHLQRKERSECNLRNSSSPRRCQLLPLRKSSSFR